MHADKRVVLVNIRRRKKIISVAFLYRRKTKYVSYLTFLKNNFILNDYHIKQRTVTDVIIMS